MAQVLCTCTRKFIEATIFIDVIVVVIMILIAIVVVIDAHKGTRETEDAGRLGIGSWRRLHAEEDD